MGRPAVDFCQECREFVPPFGPTRGDPERDVDLGERFGFAPKFPLLDELNVAAGMFTSVRTRRFPTAREKRERLDLIEREAKRVLDGEFHRAAPLGALLRRSGGGLPVLPDRLEHCYELDGTAVLPVVFDRDELVDVLERARELRTTLAAARPPISGDRALRALVYDLGRVWRRGTGTKPGRGRDGPFPRFLELVARRLCVNDSREALVKLHSRWGAK